MTQRQPIDDTIECGLHSFERNRFFHGKLMTARDMEAEQRYHRSRLRTLAEHVTGEGIVCGLETSVEADGESLVITVEPGLAIDSCGHPIVVESKTEQDLDIEQVSDPTSLYVDYENCVKETVPIPGSEDACEEECTYNRILEIFEITHEADPPPADLKAVDAIEFPARGDYTSTEDARNPETITPDDDALRRIATSYAETDTGALRQCGSNGDHRVFLGRFEEQDDGTWSRITTDIEDRPLVYTNDMLYAAIARHAARFDDPHDVTAAQTGALVSVEGVSNPGGNVDLRSSDSSVSVSANAGANAVDLTVSARIQNQLSDLADRIDDMEGRLEDMQQQLRQSTLHHKRLAFHLLSERFELEAAREVAERTTEAIEERVYEEAEAFLEFVRELLEVEMEIGERLSEVRSVSEAGVAAYRRALEELVGVFEDGRGELEEAELADRVAHAQGLVAETAEWIESQARTPQPQPEEEPTQPAEPTEPQPEEEPAETQFDASLTRKRQAFADVATAFGSGTATNQEVADIAQKIVQVTTEMLESNSPVGESQYLESISTILDIEVELNRVLVEQSAATEASTGDYARALYQLRSALKNGADVSEIVSAQNAVSTAAANLTPLEGSYELPFTPQEYTVSDGRFSEELGRVETVDQAELILAAEMAGDDRVSAETTLMKAINNLEGTQ